jgi:hypothetical protein
MVRLIWKGRGRENQWCRKWLSLKGKWTRNVHQFFIAHTWENEGRILERGWFIIVCFNVCSTIVKHAWTLEQWINKLQWIKTKYVKFSSIMQTTNDWKRVGLGECSLGRPSANHSGMKSVWFHRWLTKAFNQFNG